MKRILLISILTVVALLLTAYVWSSINNTRYGKMNGLVVDNYGKGIDCSSISLTNIKNPGETYGTLADVNGKFFINNIPYGKYYVSFYMIGFKQLKINEIVFNSNHHKIDIGRIILQKDILNSFDFKVATNEI